jgi:FtsP/CotA-like multicopper oxidase with cupredoxin domain
VHWHGLELESASDGVAGWSQTGDRQFAQIQPGDSFVAHLTQPRAGTFIYHTHFQDEIQLTSGLYGPIVVLEPGQVFQPATDHIYLAGRDGEEEGAPQRGSLPAPYLAADHRSTINTAVRQPWRLLKGDSVTPGAVARDGADLPASQQRLRRVGHRRRETAD